MHTRHGETAHEHGHPFFSHYWLILCPLSLACIPCILLKRAMFNVHLFTLSPSPFCEQISQVTLTRLFCISSISSIHHNTSPCLPSLSAFARVTSAALHMFPPQPREPTSRMTYNSKWPSSKHPSRSSRTPCTWNALHWQLDSPLSYLWPDFTTHVRFSGSTCIFTMRCWTRDDWSRSTYPSGYRHPSIRK